MTNTKLTNRRTISTRIADILVADSVPLSDAWKRLIDDAGEMELETQELRRILSGLPQYAIDGGWSAAGISAYAVRLESELQELRKFDQAKLINKFYERYPLETFRSDSERAEALGYYMAGAELQRCGEFIVYKDDNCDE